MAHRLRFSFNSRLRRGAALLGVVLAWFGGWTGVACAQAWTQVPNSGSVIAAAVMPNGAIVGVGTDKQLWTRSTLSSAWTLVPGSGAVTAVTVMPDGTIIGVGTDRQLWTRATLSSAWTLVPNSGAVTGVAVLPNGTIVGVGTDKQLWTRSNLTGPWTLVPNSGSVIAIAATKSGAVIGIGNDNRLWMRPALASAWASVPDSGAVTAVAVMPDETLLGVGLDQMLWTRAKPEGSPATGRQEEAPNDCGGACPWVPPSFAGQYLPLAAKAGLWSNPKPFGAQTGKMTVQSRFMSQKGTTCNFEVQFNNVGTTNLDERIIVTRPGKVAVGSNDFPLQARLAPGSSVAYATEVRECALNWGETKEMTKCAACEPTVYFVAH